ncbi:MAG: hypothetical protein IKJ50_01400 [Clostridia bacterium]|nr:hypothetical protein [Clostridia bacterium]
MDNELLLARVSDAFEASSTCNKPQFFGFLSLEESVLAQNFLENRNANYLFYGGFENSVRKVLCCMPDWCENPPFPITALTLNYRTTDDLRHRDFLGSLMGLGLKRETVGDILIEKGRAVVFLKTEIADYVVQNLSKVGRVGVTIQKGYDLPLPKTEDLKENTVSVASCRLDCIVSACALCSRLTAATLIESGLVAVNSQTVQKVTKIIADGDVLSVRHKGKFQVISTNKRTKKGRVVLSYKSY